MTARKVLCWLRLWYYRLFYIRERIYSSRVIKRQILRRRKRGCRHRGKAWLVLIHLLITIWRTSVLRQIAAHISIIHSSSGAHHHPIHVMRYKTWRHVTTSHWRVVIMSLAAGCLLIFRILWQSHSYIWLKSCKILIPLVELGNLYPLTASIAFLAFSSLW